MNFLRISFHRVFARDTMAKLLTVAVLLSLLVNQIGANRQKRNIIQFGLMVQNVITDGWALKFNDYACWCGFGGEGPQLDGIDKCCYIHDMCYEETAATNKDCTFAKGPHTILYSVDYDPIVCKDPEGSCGRLACECDKEAAYCFASNVYHPGLKDIQDCAPCKGYGEITKIKVTGAKSVTAKKEGVSTAGVTASQYLVDDDIAELETYRSCFVQVGQEYGIHPSLVAAIASRVSRAGKLLNAQGYGTGDTSKYGLMQCDTRSSEYGSRCTQFGPKTCEHIKMMISEKLAPDLRHALEKYSGTVNKERKGQRDAVAAYEHTITEVQSWSSPDSNTNGKDFSNDVIARAHRLIFHHKWTCDGTTPSPHLTGSVEFVPSVDTGTDTCKKRAERGDCEFYSECVEKKLPCTDEGYALGYGYRYCTRFVTFYNDFSAQGKQWVDAIKICLMKALLPQTSTKMTCDRIKKVAFDSHLKCFVSSGVDICDVVASDLTSLWNVYQVGEDFTGRDAMAVWKQVLGSISSCPGTAYKDGTELLKGINSEINAWEKSVVGEALETTERRRKRSLDCDQYVRWGDCRFYECFEDKFACGEHEGYSHVKDFELTSCMKFSGLSLSNLQVAGWMTRTQHCLMDHLSSLYEQDSLDCEMVELHMLEARVSCMLDAGMCDLDSTDEWMIDRATDRKGYPYIAPRGYTTLPENNDFVLISDYYYQALPAFKKQIGFARIVCKQMEDSSGQQIAKELYKFVDTSQFGMLKIRTEL